MVCWNWLWGYCLPYFGSLLLWDLLWLLRWEVCQWPPGKGLCIKLCRPSDDWVIQSLTICLGIHRFLKQFNLLHNNDHFIIKKNVWFLPLSFIMFYNNKYFITNCLFYKVLMTENISLFSQVSGFHFRVLSLADVDNHSYVHTWSHYWEIRLSTIHRS